MYFVTQFRHHWSALVSPSSSIWTVNIPCFMLSCYHFENSVCGRLGSTILPPLWLVLCSTVKLMIFTLILTSWHNVIMTYIDITIHGKIRVFFTLLCSCCYVAIKSLNVRMFTLHNDIQCNVLLMSLCLFCYVLWTRP